MTHPRFHVNARYERYDLTEAQWDLIQSDSGVGSLSEDEKYEVAMAATSYLVEMHGFSGGIPTPQIAARNKNAIAAIDSLLAHLVLPEDRRDRVKRDIHMQQIDVALDVMKSDATAREVFSIATDAVATLRRAMERATLIIEHPCIGVAHAPARCFDMFVGQLARIYDQKFGAGSATARKDLDHSPFVHFVHAVWSELPASNRNTLSVEAMSSRVAKAFRANSKNTALPPVSYPS